MSVGIAELHNAIYSIWSTSDADAAVRTAWGGTTGYPTLHDGEATPGQPFPYVIFEIGSLSVTSRMSGREACKKQQIQDVPVTFRIHAEQSVAKSAKENAITIAEEVLKVFGGHPTTPPTAINDMTYGAHLITQRLNEYGLRTGDTTYLWTIEYGFRLDLPVAL